jgi:uncharacterized repeat protein (TIGR01451 family)
VQGPATGFDNFPLSYQIVVSNAGPGAGTNVQVFDTLPTGTSFLPNGGLQASSYPFNDQWRDLNNGLIARGPFNIPASQSITVALNVQVPGNGDTNFSPAVDLASAKDKVYNSVASGSCSSNIVAGAPTFTDTPTISPTFSASPSVSPTLTPSRSSTPTGTATLSPSSTASPSPSATPSPAPALSLIKSSNRVAVGVAGDVITYVLQVQNTGLGTALAVNVWDTLPANVSLLSAFGGTLSSGVLNWPPAPLAPASSKAFSFSVSYAGSGTEVDNQAAMQASNSPLQLSNLNVVAVGTPFTATVTPSQTPTATPSPTPQATATAVLGPPQFALSLVLDQGVPWPTGGANDLQFTTNFQALSCACQSATDLVLTINCDSDPLGNPKLDMIDGENESLQDSSAVGSPADPLSRLYWKQVNSFSNSGLTRGRYSLSPTAAGKASIFAQVQAAYAGQTVTSRVVLSSASFGIALTATVSTYLLAGPPATATPTQVQSPIATPVAGMGQIVAFPQPATDTVCFGYTPPSSGKLEILIYNAAFQVVAKVTDDAVSGQFKQSCVSVGPMVSGVYLYKASAGGFNFPLSQFGVMH